MCGKRLHTRAIIRAHTTTHIEYLQKIILRLTKSP